MEGLRFIVYGNVKTKTGVALTDEVLDEIEFTYQGYKRQSIKSRGILRVVNVFFATVFVFVFWGLQGTGLDKWLFVSCMAFFWLYNMIHLWNEIVDYKLAKRKRFKPFKTGIDVG